MRLAVEPGYLDTPVFLRQGSGTRQHSMTDCVTPAMKSQIA